MRNDLLHRFILSMDKGEVAAFRKSDHLTSGKWSTCRKILFETLLTANQYDQKTIEVAISDTEFLSILAIEKHRMLQAATATVQDVRNRRNLSTDPWTCFEQGRLLFDMGLTDEAEVKVKQGLVQAQSVDDLFAELQLRELLRSIYKFFARAATMDAIVENEYSLQMVIQKVSNLNQYTSIMDSLGDYQKKYRVADDVEVRSAMDLLMEDPSMTDISKAISLPAQIKYASIWAFYYECIGNLGQAEKYLDLSLTLWESNLTRVGHLPHYYRQVLSNLIGVQTRSGSLDSIPLLIHKMEQVSIFGRRAAMLAFCDIELQYQLFYMNTGQFQLALEREEKVNEGIRNFGKLMLESKMVTLLYNLGIIHLFAGNSSSAKEYFTRIWEKGVLNSRLDLQGLARMFRLLLLLETDSIDNFHYFLRSYKRTFRKEMPFYRLEDAIFTWLNKHYREFGTSECRESLLQLYQELEEFETQRLVGAEELRLWALSRARGQRIGDLFASQL